MNLNRALIISFGFLTLLVAVTIINVSKRKQVKYVIADNEALVSNVHLIPEIICSYDKVKNIYGKKNVLFFRYVQTSCSTCFDSQLNELLTFQEEIGKEHIWIFPAYPDDRGSRIQLSNELEKYNYRNIPADSLLIPVYDGEPKSYFAWLNDEGEIGMVFVPDRNNVHHTRQYFLEIKRIIQKIRHEK